MVLLRGLEKESKNAVVLNKHKNRKLVWFE